MDTSHGVFGVASAADQVKIDAIFNESKAISQVTNPGHKPPSEKPLDTTRSPAAIDVDLNKMRDIIARYDAAVRAATNCPFLQDGKPYDSLHYQQAHYLYEHMAAVKKGNK